MAWFILLFLPFAVSFAMSRLLISVSVKDAPDGERKFQESPVPTAGGLAILSGLAVPLLVITVLAGTGPLALAGGLYTVQPFGGWVIFVIALGLLGALDDVFGLSAFLKLVLLAAGAAAVAAQLPAVDLPVPFQFGVPGENATAMPSGGSVQGSAIIAAVLAIWILVFTNAANFMDGADGLAFGCLAIMFAGVAIGLGIAYRPMLDYVDEPTRVVLLTPLMAVMAIAGFVAWNLRGQIYGGDTGALSIGGLFSVFAAFTGAHVGIWYPLTLALPFLVDAGLTLVYRALLRQPLLSGHREHAYQLLIRRGASPVRVAILWWGFSLICLVSAVFSAARADPSNMTGAAVFGALLVLGVGLWIWQRIAFRSRPRRMRTTERVKLTPDPPSPASAGTTLADATNGRGAQATGRQGADTGALAD
ncbi:MAG: hypothetical protein AAGJ32_05180 [Pseudomonadota bacterium]